MLDRRPLLVRLPASLVTTIDTIGEDATVRAIVRGLGRLLAAVADASTPDAKVPPDRSGGTSLESSRPRSESEPIITLGLPPGVPGDVTA
jgi:hypothetical protein